LKRYRFAHFQSKAIRIDTVQKVSNSSNQRSRKEPV
jgi:hypothetical protein